jgi:nucleoside-diphosphate-sugar epimerase
MSRRFLITGGAGFLGTHIAERLAAQNDIVLFDNFRRDSLQAVPELREHRNVTLIEGDVLDPAAVDRAVEGVDTVFHLAAIAGVDSYYRESLDTLRVNILGTINVLEAAARHKVAHFVDFSTSEVFGPDALWVAEDSPHGLGPVSDRRWVYGTSKLASEHLTLRYGERFDFACTVVRPFNVYGPRQTGEGAISNFCRAVAHGKPITVYGSGSAIRAWCYVSDLTDAVERMVGNPRAAGHVFNIGNPREVTTTLGLARAVARLVPGTEIVFREVDRAEVRSRVPVIRRAEELLDYNPKVTLEEGLRRTVDHFTAWRSA